ncbi:winged helix DNA-binding domain-containing protein [Pseudoflavitalea sp. X16]|uniref:winged helix DNA-binding domain-containing protein n=1 Tax=Paraflavitalea devenefica TaxID=2716334 RepID=UPI0014229272|nr:winged helix DNA-binding domain-containing protein [Paraflavitalea devenefica]NII24472.1 winged helix DNA-binding domain-containing protein [Paraflavitalea devenefica]
MTTAAIVQYRLYNQQLSQPSLKQPGELVHWMGSMQAQDYLGAKWSIGLRLPGSTDEDIEQAIADRKIIRTWGLRGTWHWMAPADVHWMLRLVSPKIQQKYAPYLKQESLDAAKVKKSNKVLVKALQDGQALTREELTGILSKNGIKASNYGIGHLLLHASQEQLICMGPRRGKQFTHVLLEDWIPKDKRFEPADPLAELALRYFTSHGPATVKDFMWWAGLTLAEARKGIEPMQDKLERVEVEGITYLMSSDRPALKKKVTVHLLPGFDEYLLGYTDRSVVVEDKHAKKLAMTANGQFSSTIVVGGRVDGIWKRTMDTKNVDITTTYFDAAGKSVQQAVAVAARRYAKFLGLKADL